MTRMTISQIDPQLRTVTRLSSIRHVDNPIVRAVTRVGLRLLPSRIPKGVTVRVVSDGAARVRVFDPGTAGNRAGLLWIHGGGLVVGAARQDDGICARTAAELGIVVVSADYRLAPEHPYPAAIDDVFAAWRWFVAHADELRVDTARLAIGGESAGGGLAANLVHRVHDTSAEQPIAQWLFAPMLDDRTAANHELDAIDHLVWNNRANRYGWTAYLGTPPGGATVPPYASAARRQDLAGLPPAWLYATELELFHDEVISYARRLEEAGVPVAVQTVPAAAHAFELLENNAPARTLLASARAWLGGHLTAE